MFYVSLYCFFCRSLSVHEISALLEEENRNAKVYIKPNDLGLLIDKDSANEDDSGLVDNLSNRQLATNAEAVFNNGHHTSENDGVLFLKIAPLCIFTIFSTIPLISLWSSSNSQTNNVSISILNILHLFTRKWQHCLIP